MTRLPDQRMPTGFALVTSPGTDFRVETRINQTFLRGILAIMVDPFSPI